MTIFLSILTAIIFVLFYSEKDESKREHLLWGFIGTLGALSFTIIAGLIFAV